MVTPPKGDYASVPLNDAGRKVADGWDHGEGRQCEAYGAAGLMRIPTRVHITWEDDNTLKVETDAGVADAALLLRPGSQAGPGRARTLQGHSLAEWERPAAAVAAAGASRRQPARWPPTSMRRRVAAQERRAL